MSNHDAAGRRLRRRLEQLAEAADCTIDWIEVCDRQFDTACFYGGRHCMTLLVGGLACTPWVAALDDEAVTVPGHLLVQLDVIRAEDRGEQLLVEVEAMTVKEA